MKNKKLTKYSHINNAVFSYVQENSEVLDVGCWDGSLGYALIQRKHCIVDGIDNNSPALKNAKKLGYCNIYKRDLQVLKNLSIKNSKYDYIVFADVLEHLLYPEEIVQFYIKYLKKNGKIVVSLPNIGFLLYRLKLLFGKFEYKEIGVMDKTHVKFYTLATMKDLFKKLDLHIVSYKKHNEVSRKFFLLQILKEIIPGLFTLQFVFLLQSKK